MRTGAKLLAAASLLAFASALFWKLRTAPGQPAERLPITAQVRTTTVPATTETAHYRISSTADALQTRAVADAVESLHAAYRDFFREQLPPKDHGRKLHLFLYRDREEFKRNNRSRPWAEAYYRQPTCHAYYATDAPNPTHWMIHEATHQMNREVAGFRKHAWMDEGLASYFGTSLIKDGKLLPGSIDPDTYPIRWLSQHYLSGDLAADLREGRIIPLRALISGVGGPDINGNVNLYYLHYWSLTHFLFHHGDGRHAQRYRELIAEGASLENFERRIGPVEQVQVQWYAYLRDRIRDSSRTSEVQLSP